MDLQRYLRAVRRSLWIVILVAVLGGAVSYARAATSAKVYAASVTFYVATPGINGENAFGSDQFAQDRANSYARLLSSQRFAEQVRTHAAVGLSAQDIADRITGSSQVGTVLVDARIQDTSLPRLRTLQTDVAAQFPILVAKIESTASVRIQVVSTPPVSTAPIAPRKTIDLIVGLAVGLALGLLIAALRQLIDTSIRSGVELEEAAGVPLLASIVSDPRASRNPVAAARNAPSRRAEQFRQLRTSLEFVHTAKRAQAIAVTSSVAGEGKSSTALNLAVVAAERGSRVLLVDGDLRRPTIGQLLGFDPTVGLTTVLIGRLDLDTALQKTNAPGLDVLLSGQTPPNPSELLDSDAMRELMTELRTRYDLIVFDTPPVLAVTDAAVCAALVDGVIVLYRYGKTRWTHLDSALHALRAVDARIVGVVLSMHPRRGVDGEGRSVYGGYYAAHGAASPISRLRSALSRPGRARRKAPSSLTPPERPRTSGRQTDRAPGKDARNAKVPSADARARDGYPRNAANGKPTNAADAPRSSGHSSARNRRRAR